jgi:hypothetical protein
MTHEIPHTCHSLTPTERQQILRRLKYGPALPREELAEYANKLKRDVLDKREGVKK